MKKYFLLPYFIIMLFLSRCIEPIAIEDRVFEKLLVVEALLTDELKNHVVKLSNTFALNETKANPETNARVSIVDDSQNTYHFREVSEGKYESVTPFKAILDKSYTLKIITSDGKSYSSTSEQIAGVNPINDVQLELQMDNEIGISVKAINQESNNNAKYYRYALEETYQNISPKWSPLKGVPRIFDFAPFYQIDLLEKTVNDLICYTTEYSDKIILFDTSELIKNEVKTEIQFLPRSSPKIAHRYSILAKQYVLTFEAHSYYKALKELSSNENVFIQNQPGFVSGNITSDINPNEKVIGFFEVSSYSEKRVFFNFEDFFNSDFKYTPSDCDSSKFLLHFFVDTNTLYSPAINAINEGWMYYNHKDTILTFDGFPRQTRTKVYELVTKTCGDCRELGTLTKPSFWID